MRNLHKLYYKDYFKDITFSLDNEKVESHGNLVDMIKESIVGQDFQTYDYLEKEKLYDDRDDNRALKLMKFELQVRYPGLVTGIGIRHEASVKGEFKLGMHFDYTTGLPVIYGSSVKGVLRAYFKDIYEKEGVDVDALIADIFEGKDYSDRNTELENRKSKPMYDRDVFFDAIIARPNEKGKILDSDALASHGGDKHDDPFAEPKPIAFVKIASGVTLRFRFKLVDTMDGKDVVCSKNEKRDIFGVILTTFGIGAKTNVGYGQFEVSDSDRARFNKLKQEFYHAKGKKLMLRAKTLQENEDYNSAESLFNQALDLLAANTSELRDCMNEIEQLRSIEFYRHIEMGVNLMQSKDFDAAEREFEDARNYAENIDIFTDERKSVYNLRKSELEMHRLRSKIAVTQSPESYSEWISKSGNIKTLIDKTKKWLKEGKAVDVVAMNAKVEELRSKLKAKEIPYFDKLLSELRKITD